MVKPSSSELFRQAVASLVETRIPKGKLGDLAKKLKINPGYLSDLLHGKRGFSDVMRDRFADALGQLVAQEYKLNAAAKAAVKEMLSFYIK